MKYDKRILRQDIEHPETEYKQIEKLENTDEAKTGYNTLNYSYPEARKIPNKEVVTQQDTTNN